jgi:hypothetical protein
MVLYYFLITKFVRTAILLKENSLLNKTIQRIYIFSVHKR